MHELPYEPPREGAGDSRRLARWVAAWTLVVFGAMGAAYWVALAETARTLAWDFADVLAMGPGGYVRGYVISGFSAPLAVAAFVVWLVTGRVVVVLLASVPLAFAAGLVFYYVRLIPEYGASWTLLAGMPTSAGYIVLGLLLLTRTFRRAVNAPRPRAADAGA